MPTDDNLRSMRDRARDRAVRLQLVSWHGISVARYANSEPRATLGSIDLESRRIKFADLPRPMADGKVAPWHLEALLQASQEALLAWGAEDTLF